MMKEARCFNVFLSRSENIVYLTRTRYTYYLVLNIKENLNRPTASSLEARNLTYTASLRSTDTTRRHSKTALPQPRRTCPRRKTRRVRLLYILPPRSYVEAENPQTSGISRCKSSTVHLAFAVLTNCARIAPKQIPPAKRMRNKELCQTDPPPENMIHSAADRAHHVNQEGNLF